MKWLLLLFPLTVCYYTCTYGRWALQKGYKRGGVGVFILAALVLAISLYAIYFKPEF
ncbi:hypothetical protein [Pelotomaculum propionicicum]|uniref:Uncharacterized protein n=1 Tax=Pelotomaculum propionicicum TaxID=258475 RepID=A0A4Y7RUP5_9FIRM|nr:hypothetical protein [Pelotomaculum propionicicum]NLI13506.1 hypothetical protein [Peptococcaceae bacterium]TEB12714.1 hypothetical protein Pmgp_00685 [Pelotomaculum propionicicum]